MAWRGMGEEQEHTAQKLWQQAMTTFSPLHRTPVRGSAGLSWVSIRAV